MTRFVAVVGLTLGLPSMAAAQGLCLPASGVAQVFALASTRWGAIDPVVLAIQELAARSTPCDPAPTHRLPAAPDPAQTPSPERPK